MKVKALVKDLVVDLTIFEPKVELIHFNSIVVKESAFHKSHENCDLHGWTLDRIEEERRHTLKKKIVGEPNKNQASNLGTTIVFVPNWLNLASNLINVMGKSVSF